MALFPPEHARHHSSPRISANDLARYMVAGETGKLGIIRRARDAKTAVTARYDKVREDIRAYLCDHGRTRRTLATLQNKYQAMADDPSLTAWTREDARLSVDVLASLARMENKIAGARFLPAPEKQLPLALNGVTVSVYLNVLMARDRAGAEEVGGVLFRLTKADEETEAAAAKRREIGAYAATLAYMQTQARHRGKGQPHHQLCASFDIQCEDTHWAPRNYVTRAKAMEDACRFIAAMWDNA